MIQKTIRKKTQPHNKFDGHFRPEATVKQGKTIGRILTQVDPSYNRTIHVVEYSNDRLIDRMRKAYFENWRQTGIQSFIQFEAHYFSLIDSIFEVKKSHLLGCIYAMIFQERINPLFVHHCLEQFIMVERIKSLQEIASDSLRMTSLAEIEAARQTGNHPKLNELLEMAKAMQNHGKRYIQK